MSDALLSLQRAIVARLNGDPELVALLGGARTYEHVPASTSHPFIAFESLGARDYPASGAAICEHRIALLCVSREPGTKQALLIAQRAQELLETGLLNLEGHRLANLRTTAIEIVRSGREPLRKARIRLRAVTETM